MASSPARRTSFSGRGLYPASQANWLLHPLRRLLMPPDAMVRSIALRPDDHVLELGSGPGWFSPALAKALPQGRLVLLDVQREMLDLAERRLRQAGVDNFELVEGDALSLPFGADAFDLVFLVTVLGETADPAKALREIARTLKPGGRLAVTEQRGDPDHIRRGDLERLTREAGFQPERRSGSILHYTAVFRRPAVLS